MIRNFPLFCPSLIGRDGIYSSVPQSEYTAICGVFGVSIFKYVKYVFYRRNCKYKLFSNYRILNILIVICNLRNLYLENNILILKSELYLLESEF